MKRVITFITLLVMLFAVSVNAFAAPADFVPSIKEKNSPELVYTEKDGKKVVGYIKDGANMILSEECIECILVTPLSEVEKSTAIPQAAKEQLLKIYEEIKNADKLSSVFKNLKDADKLIVRDLFDVSAFCNDIPENLKDGAVLDLTFKNVTPGVPVTVMAYVNGAWTQLDAKNNPDGTVTVYLKQVAALAFLVPDATPDVTPDTGDNFNLTFWVCMLVGSLVMVGVLVVIILRKKDYEK